MSRMEAPKLSEDMLGTPAGGSHAHRARGQARLFWILVGASVGVRLASVPFLVAVTSQLPTSEHGIVFRGSFAYVLAALESLLLTVPTAWLGLRLAPRAGLRVVPGAWGPAIRRAVWAGLGIGAGLVALDAIVMPHLPQISFRHPGWWRALLASASAGINEEIWFRLGVMTALVAAGMAVLRLPAPARVPSWIPWTSSALAALLFGALHLPQAAAFLPLTPVTVGYILLANGIAGVAFGRLYWKHGLVSAMVAHFVTDVVLHVIAPLAEA
jgi:hypothetical protein